MDNFEISDFNLSSTVEDKLTIKDYDLKNNEGNFFNVFNEGKNLGVLMNKKRFYIFVIVIVMIWVFLFSRIFYLQIVKGDYYRSLSEGNRIRIQRENAKRGIIYDRNFIPLVKNGISFSIEVIPYDLPKDQKELLFLQERLNQMIGVDSKINLSDYISKNQLENYKPRIIKESLSYEQAMKMLIFTNDINGIRVVTENKREYPYKEYFSHILGYMGNISEKEYEILKNKDYYPDDKIGKSGLEMINENELRGQYGEKKIEINSLGKEIKTLSVEKSLDGKGIVLSIDLELQQKINDYLNVILKKLNFKKASVVALNPQNGEVLAIVSVPSFDNNIFSEKLTNEEYKKLIEDPDKPMFFRAISGEYPPGSTFKLMMSAAALENKIIDEKTTFLSTGGIQYGRWFFPDWKSGGHGVTNIKKAIAESVNTYFYTIGGGYSGFNGLGLEKIISFAKKFGFSKKTGIDLPNESDGFLPTEQWKKDNKGEPWYIGDTYHLSIGQGDVLVTPLQIAMMTSVIANNGKLLRPYIVSRIIDGEFSIKTPIKIENSNFISENNIKIVQEGMRMGVTDGSSKGLNSLPVEVAGKTGTAQYGNEGKTHAWFTGYAPYDNPSIVLTILIEGGGEGSSVAVPLARDVFMWYFRDKTDSENQEN